MQSSRTYCGASAHSRSSILQQNAPCVLLRATWSQEREPYRGTSRQFPALHTWALRKFHGGVNSPSRVSSFTLPLGICLLFLPLPHQFLPESSADSRRERQERGRGARGSWLRLQMSSSQGRWSFHYKLHSRTDLLRAHGPGLTLVPRNDHRAPFSA